MISSYLQLTKPRISILFAITGLAALAMLGVNDSLRMLILTVAIFFVGGGANGLNQYFERDVDAQMARTAKKRPLPQGKIKPVQALVFSLILGGAGCVLLFIYGNFLSFALALGTILFYSVYYTLWLKPRTPYNIVIGGAAGATGPLMAWAAITGSLSWSPVLLFLLIFFWTPPHFWALALCCKEDYKKVSYPMLPLVVGDAATKKQILLYSFSLLPLSLGLYFIGAAGVVYLVGSTLLGLAFIAGAFLLYQKENIKTYWAFFAYSIFYLLALFILIIVDSFL